MLGKPVFGYAVEVSADSIPLSFEEWIRSSVDMAYLEITLINVTGRAVYACLAFSPIPFSNPTGDQLQGNGLFDTGCKSPSS